MFQLYTCINGNKRTNTYTFVNKRSILTCNLSYILTNWIQKVNIFCSSEVKREIILAILQSHRDLLSQLLEVTSVKLLQFYSIVLLQLLEVRSDKTIPLIKLPISIETHSCFILVLCCCVFNHLLGQILFWWNGHCVSYTCIWNIKTAYYAQYMDFYCAIAQLHIYL